MFPGQGTAYETCGETVWKGCLNYTAHPQGKAHIKKEVNNCGRAECPICYAKWLVDTTKKAVNRIEQGKPKRYRKAIHVTISPPKKEWWKYKTDPEAKKIRRKVDRIAKKSGMFGYAKVFHPERERCIKCGGNKKLGDMKKCEKCGHDIFEWYFSPHYHLVGYGWISWNKQKYLKSGGWIVKNHRVRKDIGATIYYQLTHCGIKKGYHAISWVGSLSWRSLKVIPEPVEKDECPYCGRTLRKITYYSGNSPRLKHLKKLSNGETALADPFGWRYETR
jgi:hypothetical protein